MASLTAPPPASFPSPLPRRRPSLPPPPSLRFPLLPRRPAPALSVSARPRRDDAPPPPDLEAEIYDFMRGSPDPDRFPTKRELLAAGRADLVRAISSQGGWLAFGWDLDGEPLAESTEAQPPGSGSAMEVGDQEPALSTSERAIEVEDRETALSTFGRAIEAEDQEPALPTSVRAIEVEVMGVEGEEPAASTSGRIMETEDQEPALSTSGRAIEVEIMGVEGQEPAASTLGGTVEMEGGGSAGVQSAASTSSMESVGVEGILGRLEKERKSSFSRGRRGKRSKGRVSRKTSKHVPGDSPDVNDSSLEPDTWRKWSLQRAGFSATEFEAAEIVPDKDIEQLEEHLSMDDGVPKATNKLTETGDGRNVSQSHVKESSKDQVHTSLQHLELKLKSVRTSLRSRTNGVTSRKGQEKSLKKLHKLSDSLEFQETEMMNARDKLRSTRAKIAVLEGKMALQIIESQKRMTEKERRLDAAQKTLLLLRTTCILWPNSASEVLLVGSFDGWASQRKMERSSSGVFSLCLKLYPGRYEFKFIVDGVWMVDPLRPIVRNNGHKNNLIIVT